MGWTADDLLDANDSGDPQRPCIVERLISSGQADPHFICRVADEMELRSRHHVAAFFQLPYALVLDPGWHRVSTLEEGLHAELTFSNYELMLFDSSEIKLRQVSPGREPAWPVVTQVSALFPLWGRRARYHGKYLHHIERGTKDNPIIVPHADSWIARPIFIGDYETNLVGRLIREIQAALRSFLPAYTIATLNEAPLPQLLYGYYGMPAPGRIVRSGASVPVTKALLQHAARSLPQMQYFADVAQAMRTKYRLFGRFEAQLIALERLRTQGETALSLIGALSLLEQTLKSIVAASGSKPCRNLEKTIEHSSIDMISHDDRELIKRARRARNALAHEEVPLRRSITTAGVGLGRQLESPQDRMTSTEVRSVLKLVFEIFREANRRGIVVEALTID